MDTKLKQEKQKSSVHNCPRMAWPSPLQVQRRGVSCWCPRNYLGWPHRIYWWVNRRQARTMQEHWPASAQHSAGRQWCAGHRPGHSWFVGGWAGEPSVWDPGKPSHQQESRTHCCGGWASSESAASRSSSKSVGLEQRSTFGPPAGPDAQEAAHLPQWHT